MRALQLDFPLHRTRPGHRGPDPRGPRAPHGRPNPRRPIACALLLAAGLFLPSTAARSQTIGEHTHAEYDLDHNDLVGGAIVSQSTSDPGQDADEVISIAGALATTYSDHTISANAEVVRTDDDTYLLTGQGRHDYDLTGIDPITDRWDQVDSRILSRAELVDELTIAGVAGTSATLELYFQVRGESQGVIDFLGAGYQDLRYTFDTAVRLEGTTSGPHSGGGLVELNSDVGSGYRAADLDKTSAVDELVMLSFDIVPTQTIPIDISFEVEPATNLTNKVEIASLDVEGFHRATYWQNGAELLGVVVKDGNGSAVPGAVIISNAGYDYPVDVVPPTPRPPSHVILSPVAVTDSDLGEYDPSQAPFENMIDQSGLQVPFTSGVTSFDVYFTDPTANNASVSYLDNWQSAVSSSLPLQGYVEFDLGDLYTIDRLALWNLSLQDIRVLVAEDDLSPWMEVGQYTLPNHISYFSTYPVDLLDLGGEHDARYLRIEVDSAHLYDPSFTYAVVGEVAVRATTPVPEPDALASLAGGIVVVTALAGTRRRRGHTASSRARDARDEGMR